MVKSHLSEPANRPTPETAPPAYRNTYGLESRLSDERLENLTQLEIEQLCFSERWPIESGGLPRVQHYHNILRLMFPEFLPDEDDHWGHRMDVAFCEEQWICLAGCAGSAKTFRSALYAVVWWLASPLRSSVILSSTTGKSMRKRGWAEVRRLYSMLSQSSKGNMLDSRSMWQAVKGDDKHAIVGIAVGEGPEEKAIDDIKGIHTQRQLVIIDEATSCRPAIFGSFCNLFSYPDDFQVIVIGNPWSHLDEMGRFSEPAAGWKSVSLDTLQWPTTVKLNGRQGVCLRFDATDSPNITHNRIVNRNLTKPNDLLNARSGLGENSPKFWSEIRGMWPPDGLNRTIFTESLLSSMDAFSRFTWSGNPLQPGSTSILKLAFLDPAFGGGDKAILCFGDLSKLHDARVALQITEEISLQINADDKKHVHYQLAEQVAEHCNSRGVKPSQFGIDASGEGGGLAAIIEREWVTPTGQRGGIIWVEFGGAASELPVSEVDARLCCDIYDRRVTELWHICREFLCSGQLRGFSVQAAFEFCNRLFTDERKKLTIETKKEMKTRLSGRSPDSADSVAGLVEVARKNGLTLSTTVTATQSSDWKQRVTDSDLIYDSVGADD